MPQFTLSPFSGVSKFYYKKKVRLGCSTISNFVSIGTVIVGGAYRLQTFFKKIKIIFVHFGISFRFLFLPRDVRSASAVLLS